MNNESAKEFADALRMVEACQGGLASLRKQLERMRPKPAFDCQICKSPASVFLSKVQGNELYKINLCEDCFSSIKGMPQP